MTLLKKKKFIEGEYGENVVMIHKGKEKSYFVADIEVWEDCPYYGDRYRVEEFLNSDLWSFDNKRLDKENIFDILMELRGTVPGQIAFDWEEDREYYRNSYDCLLDKVSDVTIYFTSDKNLREQFKLLPNDNNYIFIVG